ncbi:hypothetical protein [Streptomyces tateyamensis]|uniref:hypothetical protein n=1 Tax=Streptomyces tateyamensis TaxID=565073 RepID=UPI0011B4A4A3|nr:hypothetical protein [Streptomyces tateyamensis]
MLPTPSSGGGRGWCSGGVGGDAVSRLGYLGIGTALAVAGFFGFHTFDEFKNWLTHTHPATPSAAAATASSTTRPCFGLYCHEVHFFETGWQAAGPCTNQGCPLTAGSMGVTNYITSPPR